MQKLREAFDISAKTKFEYTFVVIVVVDILFLSVISKIQGTEKNIKF